MYNWDLGINVPVKTQKCSDNYQNMRIMLAVLRFKKWKTRLKNKKFCILTTFDVSLLNRKLELVMKCHHDWKQVLGSQPTKYEIDIEMRKPVYVYSVFGPMIALCVIGGISSKKLFTSVYVFI